MYTKPIEQWSKPSIDESVLDWEEFAPLPNRAQFPADNPFLPIKAFLGRTLLMSQDFQKAGNFLVKAVITGNLLQAMDYLVLWGIMGL